MAADTGNPLILADLSWPEARERLGQVEMALIPIGSHEQHGPNLALSTDGTISDAVARRIGARLYPRVLVAPLIPWGISPHHMRFPGTISLQPETLIALLRDVVWSLTRHGLRRFLAVNSHGGNEATLAVAAGKLRQELDPGFLGVCNWYTVAAQVDSGGRVKSAITGHACEKETSWAMHLAPQLVKKEALSPARLVDSFLPLRSAARAAGVVMPSRMDELSENGCLGDATQASAALGRDTFEPVLDRICQFIEIAVQATK